MSETQIQEISKKIQTLVAQTEKDVASDTTSEYVELLQDQEVDLEDIQNDFSDAVVTQVQRLQARGTKNSHIVKLLKQSARPQLVTLSVVTNEIASVIPKKIEVGVPSDIARLVKRLSEGQFKDLCKRIQAHYPSRESGYLVVDCSLDRWVLVVSEDKLLENASFYIQMMDQIDKED